MLSHSRRHLLVATLLILASCGKNDTSSPTEPTQLVGTMTATLDGATRFNGIGRAGLSDLMLVITGAQASGGVSRQVAFVLAKVALPGRYEVRGESGHVASILEKSDLNFKAWRSDIPGATGFIEITRLTNDRVSGRFAFSALPVPDSPASGTRQAEGEFDLPLARE